MKRFTETQKWDDPWFRRLSPEMKLLWQWLCDRCDNAGVIDPDLELASFHIGYQYPTDTLSHGFGDRLVQLPCGKWFIPKFIEFQYGQISRDCKAHNPIFQSLEKHQVERVSKGYGKGIHTLQEKEKEKDSSLLEGGEGGNPEMKPLCTLKQARSMAAQFGLTEPEAEHWWHVRNRAGWTCGTNGGHPRRITSAQSDMATSVSWIKESAKKNPSPKPAKVFFDKP